MTGTPIYPVVPSFRFPTQNFLSPTLADFTALLLNLLPDGWAWPKNPTSNMYLILSVLAPVFQRMIADDNALLVDAYPGTTNFLLPQWQATLGLPDPCYGGAATEEQARNQVLYRLINSGGQSINFIISAMAQLGFKITITESPLPFLAGTSTAGDSLASTWSSLYWYVNSPLLTDYLFTVGVNRAGDPLVTSSNNTVLECEINSLSPAHTTFIFNFQNT